MSFTHRLRLIACCKRPIARSVCCSCSSDADLDFRNGRGGAGGEDMGDDRERQSHHGFAPTAAVLVGDLGIWLRGFRYT